MFTSSRCLEGSTGSPSRKSCDDRPEQAKTDPSHEQREQQIQAFGGGHRDSALKKFQQATRASAPTSTWTKADRTVWPASPTTPRPDRDHAEQPKPQGSRHHIEHLDVTQDGGHAATSTQTRRGDAATKDAEAAALVE